MKKIFIILLVISLFVIYLGSYNPVFAQDCGDGVGTLFISEYVEGSSNNKALEIFNGYGTSVDLSHYAILIYFNGSTTAGTTIQLNGTLNSGDVHVLADDDWALAFMPDQVDSRNFFNGDDAVELRQTHDKDGNDIPDIVLDVIGQVGVDPGTEWGSGVTSTADNTIRRQSSVIMGDVDGSDSFDPSIEWTGYPQNTEDGLGSHTHSCTPTAITFNSLSANSTNNNALFALAAVAIVSAGSALWLRRRNPR